MTNFIFKSQGTYKKLCQQLIIIQSELRHQRSEHAEILRCIHKLLVDRALTEQSLDYYQDKEETSPQTDPVTEIDKLQYKVQE